MYHLGIGNIVAKSTLAVANEIVLTLFNMIGQVAYQAGHAVSCLKNNE